MLLQAVLLALSFSMLLFVYFWLHERDQATKRSPLKRLVLMGCCYRLVLLVLLLMTGVVAAQP